MKEKREELQKKWFKKFGYDQEILNYDVNNIDEWKQLCKIVGHKEFEMLYLEE